MTAIILSRLILFLVALSTVPMVHSEPREIFLLIGQSNMAGRGKVEDQDEVSHPRIFKQTEDMKWVPAIDPLHFDKPEIIGVGLGSSFARVVANAESNAVIGLVPAAFGGSSLDEWGPGTKHYTNAIERTQLALSKGGRLRAILWHQGESDRAPEKMATYPRRFADLVARLRADLAAPHVPIIVGELFVGQPANGPMNAMLNALPKTVTRCATVSAKDLTDIGDDQTHFDSPSLRELGRRYAEAFFTLERAKEEGHLHPDAIRNAAPRGEDRQATVNADMAARRTLQLVIAALNR